MFMAIFFKFSIKTCSFILSHSRFYIIIISLENDSFRHMVEVLLARLSQDKRSVAKKKS